MREPVELTLRFTGAGSSGGKDKSHPLTDTERPGQSASRGCLIMRTQELLPKGDFLLGAIFVLLFYGGIERDSFYVVIP
jgi:hypothetical protein